MDLDFADGVAITQAEMQPLVARRLIAAGCRHCGILRPCRREHTHLSSDRVVIAFHADKVECNPVIRSLGLVQQDPGWAVIGTDDRVHLSIIIDVANREAARCPRLVDTSPEAAETLSNLFPSRLRKSEGGSR